MQMQEHEHELLAMHKKLDAAKKQAAAAAAASSAAACTDHAGASKASLAPEVLALSRHQYPACADAATASRAAVQMLQPSPMLFNPDLPVSPTIHHTLCSMRVYCNGVLE